MALGCCTTPYFSPSITPSLALKWLTEDNTFPQVYLGILEAVLDSTTVVAIFGEEMRYSHLILALCCSSCRQGDPALTCVTSSCLSVWLIIITIHETLRWAWPQFHNCLIRKYWKSVSCFTRMKLLTRCKIIFIGTFFQRWSRKVATFCFQQFSVRGIIFQLPKCLFLACVCNDMCTNTSVFLDSNQLSCIYNTYMHLILRAQPHLHAQRWYSISQEICTRFLLCCALLWLYIDWFSNIHQVYFTGTVAI